ncbi:angiopoietin-like protein 8 [Ochotona princeps]|uniref:angiopoietin-like protein 8 n=1 Tax=Ochotona princeps TaxID=9978 RepID=UPI002714DCDE|nr:angiopoietin-like protein 8 [Ochotona princeps]
MITPALCLLWALAALARPTPPIPTGGPEEPAQGEELTLLFHGALQLGQALNGVYKATDTQLTEAGRNLGLYGHTLQLLRRDVSWGRAAAQELRASLKQVQTEGVALQLQAEATAQELAELAQGQRSLRDSVWRLEGKLLGARLGQAQHQELEALKVHADKQSHMVWALAGHLQRQRQEMAAQQRSLRQIQHRCTGWGRAGVPGGPGDHWVQG